MECKLRLCRTGPSAAASAFATVAVTVADDDADALQAALAAAIGGTWSDLGTTRPDSIEWEIRLRTGDLSGTYMVPRFRQPPVFGCPYSTLTPTQFQAWITEDDGELVRPLPTYHVSARRPHPEPITWADALQCLRGGKM